jgi:hypothetical protein
MRPKLTNYSSCRAQTPEDLPLDLREEIHIPADRTSVAYRKLLKSKGLGENFSS